MGRGDGTRKTPRPRPVDPASARWVRGLTATGAEHEDTLRRLHELLVKVALAEAHRRAPRYRIAGPEVDGRRRRRDTRGRRAARDPAARRLPVGARVHPRRARGAGGAAPA